MAEYIERESLRNTLYESDAITFKGLSILNTFPAANVIEVVRCKDCKYCEFFYPQKEYCKEAISTFYCNLFKSDTKATDYCSCGVRKGGGSGE